jgi:hypothetical protein
MRTNERLTLEQLHETQCFIGLTSKQKRLVEAFVESNGDKTASVLAAYAVKNARNAQILASQVFASPAVVACLATYYQDDPLESFKAEVRRAYHNKKLTVAQVRAMTLHADLNGWGSASLPKDSLHGRDVEPSTEDPEENLQAPADPEFYIGQRVTERDSAGVEHVGIVKALDASGRPSEIEEVKS